MRKIIFTIAMLSVVAVNTALAQSRVVTGTVKDNNGDFIAGATVSVKGTDVAVATDENGKFSIEIPEGKSLLVIDAFGNDIKEQRVSSSINDYTIDVVSKGAATGGEVKIYGQTVDKRSYVGAVNRISGEDIAKRPVSSVGAALDGAAPGLLVTSGGGQPGNNPDIMLRGQGSLSASSSPLIVVDGAPYSGALTTINPLDIKDLVVLKDATSKAVYGARAANGVILITTKRGEKSDRPRINVDASIGLLNRFIPEYDRLKTKDYYEMAYIGLKNALSSTVDENTLISYLGGYLAYDVPLGSNQFMDANGKVLVGDDKLIWTDDWTKELARIGVRQNYNVSVQNANETSDYYLSIGYTRDQGIVKNSDWNRITGLLNVNSKVTDWLKTGFKMQVAYDDQLFHLGSGTAYSNPFFAAREMGSIYPVYRYNRNGTRMVDAKGNPIYDFGVNDAATTTSGQYEDRPFGSYTNSIAALTYNKPYSVSLNGNAVGFIEADITKSLKAKSMISLNYLNSDQLNYYNSIYGDASNVDGRASRGASTNINYTFNQFVTWTPQAKNLNDTNNINNFSLTVGHENYNWKNQTLSATKIGFPLAEFSELSAAATTEGASSQTDYLRIETYFAQAEYNYKEKIYLNGSFSRNGSSRFSPSARWGSFGAAGIAWVLSEEKFLKKYKKDITDMLKVRFSWGVSGNDAIGGYYSWMDRFAVSANANNPGLAFANWGNPALRWEGSVDMNFGIDITKFKSRLNASIDLYNRGSNNLLYVQPLAQSTGSTGYYSNVGAMRNRGVELSLGYDVLKPKATRPGGVFWNTRLNLAINKNAITKMQGEDTILGGGTIMAKGLAVGTFFLPEYAGVDANGNATWYVHSSGNSDSVTSNYSSLTPDDRKVFGSSFRAVEGSWTNTVAYKQLTLSVTATFGIGGKYYDNTYAGLVSGGSGRLGNAMHVDLLNSWKQAGDENNKDVLPKFSYGNAARFNGALSNNFLISNSFLRVRNINLGYSFSPKMLNRSSIKSARIYLSMDNALNFSARKGVDVQSGFFGASDFTYFPYRTMVFGVNLGL